jgi:hypothetical protein
MAMITHTTIICNVFLSDVAHPVSCAMGTGSSPEVKRPGCGAYHPPHSNAEVKKRVELYFYPLWVFGSLRGTYTFFLVGNEFCILIRSSSVFTGLILV